MELRKLEKAPDRPRSGKNPIAEQMQAIVRLLSPEERRALLRRSNWRGLGESGFTSGVLAAAAALTVYWPNPLSIVVALLLIGSRQLGLAILMHEAAHRSLLRSAGWNDRVGAWLCAAPLLLDLFEYRNTHQQHHLYTGMRYDGQSGDPDLVLVRFYPLSRKGLRRWLWRDLTGRVMWRVNALPVTTRLGYRIVGPRGPVPGPQGQQPIARQIVDIWKHFHRSIIFYAVLAAGLLLAGWWLPLLLWFVAWYCVYPLFLRIRLIAEHGMVERSPNLLANTRTTLAAWWERLLFAPHHVHYHLEHHLMPAVPCYRLPQLHCLLKKKGALDQAEIASGYAQILRLASARE